MRCSNHNKKLIVLVPRQVILRVIKDDTERTSLHLMKNGKPTSKL